MDREVWKFRITDITGRHYRLTLVLILRTDSVQTKMDLIQRAGSVYRNEGGLSLAKKALLFPLYHSIRRAHNYYWNIQHGSGTSILTKEWDNLLLLDACRYDEFCRVSPFDPSIIDKRVTLGSKTPEFLQRTFSNTDLHDVVYVTANPQPLKFLSEYEGETPIFYDTISLLDEWDANTQTVSPETVRKAALEAAEMYPNKRLLIHFLQPHAPFLGPTAEAIKRRTGKTVGGLDPGRDYTEVEPKNIETATYLNVLNEGVTREKIRSAYRETLRLVINECLPLINTLPGKTVITSDHGELLGDRIYPFGREHWEHPRGYRTTELCVVPWIEFDDKDQKRVISEPPKHHTSIEQEKIEKRLHSLGYK